MKIVVITGGSSGIGLGVVKALVGSDCKVYELSRRDFEYKDIIHRKLDVTDEVATQEVIKSIYENEKRIDILINCAGYGIAGAVEFTELADAKKQLDVNFYGVVNVTKAVLPYMREARSGRIVNISSVAAVAPIPYQTYYSVSKAAINAYSEALCNEVQPFGISVTAIMPGDIKTGFTAARETSIVGNQEYQGRIVRSVQKMEQDEMGGMDPDVAGKYIAKIALKKKVKPLYSIGFTYKILSLLARHLPSRIKSYIIMRLYG